MLMKLKTFLDAYGITQAELARAVGISRTAMNNLMNDKWPAKRSKDELTRVMTVFFREQYGIPETPPDLFQNEVAPDPLHQVEGGSNATNTEALEFNMLLRKQTLTPAARKQFSLFRDPFAEEAMQGSADVFTTQDSRYVREALWSCARFGGFMAVVGESGSGKSTLRRDLLERIQRENEQCIVIEPYVLGMEDNDRKGKTLKASSIAEAIITTVAPMEKPRMSPEARYAQLHRLLRDSSRAGNKHLLVIEEAHGLPLPTLKHLKRFRELEDGFRKLISVVLIGQPELRLKLSETNPEVREVTQRIELVELQPLDTDLEQYLAFKFKRVGCDLNTIITPTGIDAMRNRLTINAGKRGKVSLLYPLAVNNFLTACMNMAADIGIPTVDADVIKEV